MNDQLKNDKDDIKVSVICTVYNHGPYIRQTLESLVNQITSFNYEIIVHDDASTDGSTSIIKEYEGKYANIVAIYQHENQYTNGGNISKRFIYPIVRGKYIALCEGDDYWIDPYKLQKQFDVLEKHSDIDISSCGANIINALTNETVGKICPREKNCIIPIEEVIKGGGEYLATNTLFFRKEVAINESPILEMIAIDYTLQISGALRGGVYYIADIMAVYRQGVSESWTDRMKKNRKAFAKNRQTIIEMLKVLDKYTKYQYTKSIHVAITENEYFYCRATNQENLLLDSKYKRCIRQLPMKSKVWFYFKAYFHVLFIILNKLQRTQFSLSLKKSGIE